MTVSTPVPSSDVYAGWKTLVAKYQRPDMHASVWQLITSYGGLLLSWGAMYLSWLYVGYWLTLLLALPAAGFVVRIFIIQHDCGHGSFFRSRRANDVVGAICGAFTFVPYKCWRKSHSIHHAHHAELEERGIGDVWTMTVEEYWSANRWNRMLYRVYRNPFFLFGLAPAIYFLVLQRLPVGVPAEWKHGEKISIWWTNLAIAGIFVVMGFLFGFGAVLAIGLPTVLIASSVGTWMFYVQHQFERTYWEHTPQWNYTLAAMHGSSYYKLPRLLQWFTGNIGFHHIHHLSPRIPNYNLQKCHDENTSLQQVVHLTLITSFKSVKLALWDEEQRRLLTFHDALQAKRDAVAAV